MKEIARKDWDYVLFQSDESYVLEVVCGTSATYEVVIVLNRGETKRYQKEGDRFIESLAAEIRRSPTVFEKRVTGD